MIARIVLVVDVAHVGRRPAAREDAGRDLRDAGRLEPCGAQIVVAAGMVLLVVVVGANLEREPVGRLEEELAAHRSRV